MKEDVVMHKNSPSLHVASGFAAFLIYALMLILLIGGFRFYKEQVRYGEEEAVMAEILANESIELADIAPQEDSALQELQQAMTQENTPQEQIEEKMTESIAKQEAETPKEITPPKQTLVEKTPEKLVEKPKEAQEKPKEVNLADVFANVSSKTSQDIRKEEEAKRQKELDEARKQRDEAQKAKQAQLTQNALALEQSTKALQQATQNLKTNIKQAMTTKIMLEKPKFSGNAEDKKKYDKWYAQIEQILMSEWQKSGGFHQAATSAKVRIRIDAGGKLTYLYMVSQSPYGDYNSSVIAFLRKMETRLFPPPPAEGVDLSMELENTLRH